ncbi:MAG: carbohydrate-binding protein [Bacteroidales bacterium]
MKTVTKFKIVLILSLVLVTSSLIAQTTNLSDFVSKHDLIWNNTVDSSFYNGAFIGDGVQGAMITQDGKNPNGLCMLLGHYKAYSNHPVTNLDYANQRVYAGNIIIAPIGKTTTQTMRLNIWDGEASGTITTDKGTITWSAIDDRKNLVFIVKLIGQSAELTAKLAVREEWGVSPAIWLANKQPSDYPNDIPPKPVLSKQGDIDIVTNKMQSKGAHVVASKIVKEADGTQILYVAIGADDNANTTTAATNAMNDAIARIQKSVTEGHVAIITRHRDWWHNYYKTSYVEIKEDAAWEKYWWLQIYKFACASSETSSFIIDTQGPWIYKSKWAAIWWNLNVQLSYTPMYSANKLGVGKSFINGMDRLYKSGALATNANGVGIDIGRMSTYDGLGSWGDEYGNMPWLLHCYWKYWKYSANDTIGKALYPMLKDNAKFLMANLEKQTDGKYHVLASRSPEYTDDLHKDANYALMGLKWELQTLLEMDTKFGMNDPMRSTWLDRLTNLVSYPTDINGLRVNIDQGFDIGHRHYSHLLSIYPYHTLYQEQGADEKSLITTSLDRWYNLASASGAAGYTYTGSCAMYATLGNGDKAIAALDRMKTSMIQPNTMYKEGGGAVVETPLSAVESIDYMLLQSWNGLIRIFPAVPARWQNISFKDLRTEGAFLVSASYNNSVISGVSITSLKGLNCRILNPWKGKGLIVKDETGAMQAVTSIDDKFTFATQAGKIYYIKAGNPIAIKSGQITTNPASIKIKLTTPIIAQTNYSGITLKKNGTTALTIQQILYTPIDSTLELKLTSNIIATDVVKLFYSNGNIMSKDSVMLQNITDRLIDNLLPGAAPRLLSAITNLEGTEIALSFNKKMQLPSISSFVLKDSLTNTAFTITGVSLKSGDSTTVVIKMGKILTLPNIVNLSYNGVDVQSKDLGKLLPITAFHVENISRGTAPVIISGLLYNNASSIQIKFNKTIVNPQDQLAYFKVKINGVALPVNNITSLLNTVSLNLSNPIRYGDVIQVNFAGGILTSSDNGQLSQISDYSITNNLVAPVYSAVPGKIEGESYYAMSGISTETTTDTGGGKNIGSINANDWTEYAINVAKDTVYRATFRLAVATGCNFSVLLDEVKITDMTAAKTGGYQTFSSFTKDIPLKAGKHYLRILFTSAGFNFNWVQFDIISPTGIAVTKEAPLKVYPNPLKNEFFIENTEQEYTQLEIKNLISESVLSRNIEPEQLNKIAVSLPSGLYILTVSNATKKQSTKIIVK